MRSSSENNLRACLKEVAELPMANRQRVVTRLDPWNVLPPSWRGLLMVAIQETEIPENDAGQTGQPLVSMRKNIGRRGGKGKRGNIVIRKLETIANLIESSDEPDAFRLATLLVHKTLNASEWESNLDSMIDELRQSCSKGVHPVWSEMAEKTPILAQFASFPIAEIQDDVGEIDQQWLANARIDITDTIELGKFLSLPTPFALDAKSQVELRKISAVLNRRSRSIEWLQSNIDKSLLEMGGSGRIISAIILSALGSEKARDCLIQSADENPILESLVNDMQLLLDLRESKEINWSEAISIPEEDGLSRLIKTEAWSSLPLEFGRTLTVDELTEGLNLLSAAGVDDTEVRWSLVAANLSSKNVENARDLMSGLQISKSEHLQIAQSVGVVDLDWMKTQMNELSIQQLLLLIESNKEDSKVRILAANQLHAKSPVEWKNCIGKIIPLFVENAEIEQLAIALMAIEGAELSFPWEVILVHHLHSATADKEISSWLDSSHQISVEVYPDNPPPRSLSELSTTLLSLLEGSSVDLGVIAKHLSKDSFQAFRACRYSFGEADILIRDSELEKLETGVAESELTGIERRLFESVVENVSLNRSAFEMQRDIREWSADSVEDLISAQSIRHQLLVGIKGMILEHHIPVPSLILWFQENDPNSVYHHIAKAAVSANNGNRLEAARGYSHAGNARSELEFNDCISLLRTSLIHFAHAENWVEARSVLSNNEELLPSITPRFQIYLDVQYYASQNQHEKATKILLKEAMDDVAREVFNDDGDVEIRMFHEPSTEKLHRMIRYPVSHGLPLEPFQGRIRAALRQSENRGRRSSRMGDFERQYNECIQNDDITTLYELASEQSEIAPLRGLTLLDRSIHSGKISSRSASKLQDSMRSLFQMHQKALSVSDRRLLRNLSLENLVIVDTNILIDSLYSRIADLLELSNNIRLDLVGNRYYHHMLLHLSNQFNLKLHIPKTAREELKAFSIKEDRLIGLFDKMHIDSEVWKKEVTSEKIESFVNQIIKDFNTWRPPINAPSLNTFERSNIEDFLLRHVKVYEKLTDMKGKDDRTTISGHKHSVFPESGDIEIMLTCANLAGQSLPKIGTITVASQDSDFTHVSRAFEEEFGFAVAKNANQLRQHLTN